MEKEDDFSTAGGLQADTTTLEISLVVPHKTGHDTTEGPHYTIPGQHPEDSLACKNKY